MNCERQKLQSETRASAPASESSQTVKGSAKRREESSVARSTDFSVENVYFKAVTKFSFIKKMCSPILN